MMTHRPTDSIGIAGRTIQPARWGLATLSLIVAVLPGLPGCLPAPPPNGGGGGGELNTSDPTNGGASYIQSSACGACHADKKALVGLHGHSQMLHPLSGGPPVYPPEATRAGVPNPPDSLAWTDVSFVIGGYLRGAKFVDSMGYLMTDGVEGFNTAWNLDFLPNGTVAGFSSNLPSQVTPLPYDCFRCHTTGPSSQGHQNNLPGILGTWAEPGVQCEACHGPGSRHPANAPANIYINSEASFCGTCHTNGGDPNIIAAQDGYIANYAQYPELLASPHASFRCITCHDPHTSVEYEPNAAFTNTCRNCHATQTMALHDGIIFVRGDYVETMSCVSCHMPFASKVATTASPAVVGPLGRMADNRSHIFFVNTGNVDYTAMFTPNGTQVVKDSNGQAAVTVDFVCIRCHNGIGRAFALTVKSASEIAQGIHTKVPPQ
jgi:hypothetical protein